MNKNKIPISNGSVGKYRFTGIPGIISSSCTERGVKKTTANKILSREIKLAKTNSKITGKNAI
jgi:hypothetical protein